MSPSDAGSIEHSETSADFPPPPPPLNTGGKLPSENLLMTQPTIPGKLDTSLHMHNYNHQQHRQDVQQRLDIQQRIVPTPPVKAELVTNELDTTFDGMKPPPYHIAATKSKYIGDFVQKTSSTGYSEEQHFYENQVKMIKQKFIKIHEKSVYKLIN